MQQWEYLEVLVHYYGISMKQVGEWHDSMGRRGNLVRMELEGHGFWYHSGGLLNELGAQGWELVGIEEDPVQGSGSGVKWVLKRPKA
jgi:hypothetical protein